MPRFGIALLSITSTLWLNSTAAQGTDLIAMAHKAGFQHCDRAIAAEFNGLSQQGKGLASTGYFNNRSFSVMATWGDSKDSIWKNTTFIKFGRRCLAYSLVGSTFPNSCAAFQKDHAQWQAMKTLADFTWTQNDSGVNALLKTLPGGGCSVTYRLHQTYPIDTLQPSQSTQPNQANSQHKDQATKPTG